MRIQVKDFMSKPVTTALSSTTVSELKLLMSQKAIHAIPIVKYNKKFPKIEAIIQGIVTQSDLSKNIKETTKAKDIMTSKVHIVHKNSSAKAAAAMMLKHKVHHIVAMDDGEIIGMLSSLDFVKLVSEHDLD